MKKCIPILIVALLVSHVYGQRVTGTSPKGSLTPKGKLTGQPAKGVQKSSDYYTPFLVAEIVFTETNQNQMLDANEDGTLVMIVKNIGQQPAKSCRILISHDYNKADLEIKEDKASFDLAAGESKTVNILLRGTKTLNDGKARITININEAKGFDLDPAKIVIIPTRKFQPPRLELADYGITDQNMNQRIEKFEKFDLTLRIQNRGESVANDVKVKLTPGTNVLPMDVQELYPIGELQPGDYHDITAILVTNARATEVRLEVEMTEQTGKFSSRKSLNLPFDVAQKKAGEIEIAPLLATTGMPDVANLKSEIAEDLPRAAETKNHAVAVIIGNRNYEKAPRVDFARNDAALMRQYAEKTLGFRPENIIYLEDATQSQFINVFGNEVNPQGQLYSFVKKGLSEVFVYYSGHGAPDPNSGKGYLVPVDCDPNFVTLNGYSLQTLFANLDKTATEKELVHITVVLDACFSGESSGGNLLKAISPVVIRLKSNQMSYPHSTIFTSSTGDQVSNWYSDKKHGLFTYFFLKGLKGEADFNHDNYISAAELFQYTSDEVNGVPYWSGRINSGRRQNPTMSGSGEYLLR